jgi:hypothetical protein
MHVASCDSIESVVAAAHTKAAMLPQAEKAGFGSPECTSGKFSHVQKGIEQLGTEGVSSKHFCVRLVLFPTLLGSPVAPGSMAGPAPKRVWYYCSTLFLALL